jgi:hypothetical protein
MGRLQASSSSDLDYSSPLQHTPVVNMADEKVQTFDIPKTCKAGVVVNEGPDFHVEVQDVPVPEPGMPSRYTRITISKLTILSRTD